MGAGTEVLDVLTRIQSFNLLAHRFGIWVISIYRVRRASRKPGPGPGPNPDRTEPATQLMMTCIFQILFWFLLDRFGLPKIEKVFKSGWFKSCQVYNSSFLACWLIDFFWTGFGFQKLTKESNLEGWFQSFQFYRSDLLVWWLWFPFGQVFDCQRLKKYFKSGWFKSCQVYNSSFLACWLLISFGQVLAPKTDKGIKSGWFQSFQFYRSDLLVWWLWFHLDKFWLPKIEKVFKSGWFKSCQVYNSSFLACWILISFGQVLASKNWQRNQIWLIPIISILSFWSPSLVTLIPFGQVLAAKDWNSIQIWLIQTMSNLTFWFGGCDSFWTGLGCQSLKKYSNLADWNHFNSNLLFILVWWLWFLLDRFWLPKIEKVFKFGWFQSFQFCVSALLVWWIWFLLGTFWLPKIEKVFKSGWFQSFQFCVSALLVWWLWFLLDRFLAAKDWKKYSNLADSTISFQFWPSGLVALIPFGQDWAAKVWKSIQIWLIHGISILTFYLFWFGDFDFCWTGFGCQRVKKYSNLADSHHFNSIVLIS